LLKQTFEKQLFGKKERVRPFGLTRPSDPPIVPCRGRSSRSKGKLQVGGTPVDFCRPAKAWHLPSDEASRCY